MSYDLYFLKPGDGESVDEAVERLFYDDSEEVGEGPVVPEKEALKERLAKALIDTGSGLARFQFDYAAVAESLNTTEEEARRQWRHIELNPPDDGNGIQITIEDDSATLTIPYWHQGDEAKAAFDEIWQYARVFETEAGYLAYDPQLEKQLDLSNDLAEAISAYTGVSCQMDSIVAAVEDGSIEEQQNPWWKFW